MTVRELIRELETCEPDAEVRVDSAHEYLIDSTYVSFDGDPPGTVYIAFIADKPAFS